MKIVMKNNATLKDVGQVLGAAEEEGFSPYVVREKGAVSVCIPDGNPEILAETCCRCHGVEGMIGFTQNFKMVSRESREADTIVSVGGVPVGGPDLALIAGPCAVESREQLLAAAEAVRDGGAALLRGGAFKPRSSPYAFQGLKEKGLEILAEARERFGLPVVTEVISPDDVELVASYADCLQVGARNMQNYRLLEALGSVDRPVLLKRGMMSTIEELLLSAEYILASGNPNVILCERGIRTFERQVRNTLDVTAVAVLKDLSHLPVLVDPSHATGVRRYVTPAGLAGLAAGADGLIVEVHPEPHTALCDGPQSLTPEGFRDLAVRAAAMPRGSAFKKATPEPPAKL